jgi:hypothetical protein
MEDFNIDLKNENNEFKNWFDNEIKKCEHLFI